MTAEATPGAALGIRDLAPESVLVLAGGRAILLQLANPAVGHGVAGHSDFASRPLDRLTGTLAATAVATWHGARIFRVHEVTETRQVVDMVDVILGRRPPARTIRGRA